MTVHRTARNLVCAYDPQENDTHVETWLIGSEQRQLLNTRPIGEYQAAVEWAQSMADQMKQHIELLPIDGAEYIERNRAKLETALAGMNGQQLGGLRQLAVTTCAEAMRDCADPEVREQAYEALKTMKVVQ